MQNTENFQSRPGLSRRGLMQAVGAGIGGVAIVPLLTQTGLMAADAPSAPRASGDPQKVFQKAVDDAIAAGEIGLQIAVYKNGKEVVNVWGGIADQKSGRKVDANTLFNVFSVTKGWTNMCLQLQAERGLIDYNKPVAFYWPEFGVNGKDKCTVRDALSHRGGVPYMPDGVTPEKMADYEWMVKELAAMKPVYTPGTKNGYHSYTWGWLIAELVRRTDPKKRPFVQFFQEELLKPLGVKDTYMGVPESVRPRIATMYGKGGTEGKDPASPNARAIPVQVDTSPGVWALPAVQKAVIPGAGGITSAISQIRLWAMLANGGELDGVRLLSPERIRAASLPRPGGDEIDVVTGFQSANVSTLGFWMRGTDPIVGTNPHIIGQLGAGISIGWADPDNNLAVAVCHNRFGNTYSKPLAVAVSGAYGVT